MPSRRLAPWTFALIGAGAFLLLQLHVAAAWTSYYSHFPLAGYQHAMEEGRIPPFFTTSVRSLQIGCGLLVFLPLGSLWFRNGSRRAASMGLWAGVLLAVISVWLSSAPLRQDSNMWPIDLVVLSLVTGAPLFVGTALQAVLQEV